MHDVRTTVCYAVAVPLKVDALSAANSAAATGSLFRDRELERLALSESDALSEVSRLRVRGGGVWRQAVGV